MENMIYVLSNNLCAHFQLIPLTMFYQNNLFYFKKWQKHEKRCNAFHSIPAKTFLKMDFPFNSEYISLFSFADFSILSASLDIYKIFKFYVFIPLVLSWVPLNNQYK
jgi:hypothetical protein